MSESVVETESPRLRLDIPAIVVGISGTVLFIATFASLVVEPALHPFGAAGDRVARSLLSAYGCGTLLFFAAGWTALEGYITRRPLVAIARRVTGWLLLSLVMALVADRLRSMNLSPYGAGGSIGAYLRWQLDGLLPTYSAWFATVVLGLLASWLIAEWTLTLLWNGARLGVRTILTLNGLVSKGANHLFGKIKARLHRPAPERLPEEVIPLVLETMPNPEPAKAALPAAETVAITRAPTPTVNPVPGDRPPMEDYELPSLTLLADPDPFPAGDHEQKLRDRAAQLEKTFQEFSLNVKVVGIHTGPVITQYEVALDTGLRLNKVTTLSDDLALKLGVSSVRIVAPLPGRNTVGIEVPNDHRQTVRLKELILATSAKAAKMKLPLFLGKDVEGRPLVYDMADMPHLLIAGRTGTGKSVCLNTILQSFLLTRKPDECRLILIDPKQVEFNDYGKIPHLMHPVVTKNQKAEAILGWAVEKMEERYDLLRRARVRNIHAYNELGWEELLRRVDPQTEDERKELNSKLPYIVIVIDEVGDLLMEMKKEVESHIIRLAQKSRAAGIHLILATQRPTVDVITGLIKSNLPARICFQVASRSDSAVVIDEKGAEKLLGMGDMLFLQPKTSTIIRGQGTYVDDREIERVTSDLEVDEPNYEHELLNLKSKTDGGSGAGGAELGDKLRDRDALYEQAIEIVIREQRGSTSLLQRALGIGYGRASRLIDFMAEDGIVGGFNGSNAREVMLTYEDWESRRAGV